VALPKKYTVNTAYWHGRNPTMRKKQIVGAGTANTSLTASTTLPAEVNVMVTGGAVSVTASCEPVTASLYLTAFSDLR